MVFSHDGLRDSLTRLAAPPFLYESLKREISLAERNESALTAMAFILESDQPIYDYPIVAFSEIASRAIRLEDHVARMGADNFVALISSGVEVEDIGIFGPVDPISCACILGLPVVRKNANKTI